MIYRNGSLQSGKQEKKVSHNLFFIFSVLFFHTDSHSTFAGSCDYHGCSVRPNDSLSRAK